MSHLDSVTWLMPTSRASWFALAAPGPTNRCTMTAVGAFGQLPDERQAASVPACAEKLAWPLQLACSMHHRARAWTTCATAFIAYLSVASTLSCSIAAPDDTGARVPHAQVEERASGGDAAADLSIDEQDGGGTGTAAPPTGESRAPSIDPDAILGCREPSQPGCSTSCTYFAQSDTCAVHAGSYDIPDLAGPDGGVITQYLSETSSAGACSADCPPLARCSLAAEMSLRALLKESPKCGCDDSEPFPNDNCMVRDSCGCWCNQKTALLAACSTMVP